MAAGPWGAEAKQAVLAAVANAVGDRPDLQEDSHGGPARQQTCTFVEEVFTQGEWDILKDPGVCFAEKQRIIAARFAAIGLLWGRELLLKRAAAILHCVCYKGEPVDANGMQACAKKIKFLVKSLKDKGRWPFPFIKTYPANPKDLPADVYMSAYGQSPPVHVDEPSSALLDQIMDEFNYRGKAGY